MIKVNDIVVPFSHFPDNSCRLLYDTNKCTYWNEVTFLYENDEEILQLFYLISHLKARGLNVHLTMPYIPNARQDRIQTTQDVFTLKYFCNFINNMNIDRVTVFDPHSPVSTALLDRVRVETPQTLLNQLYDMLPSGTYCAYPDGGSYKRYCTMLKVPAVFGVKERDWETMKIRSLRLAGSTHIIPGHSFLIIDDIVSKGSTIYWTAKQLKELGATEIYVYTSHCENTVLEPWLDGQSLLDIPNLIDEFYTTNSIFTKQHPKIKIIKTF